MRRRILSVILLIFVFTGCHCQNEKFRALQYYNRAMDKVFRNDHIGALADFTEAIKLDSGFIEAYENRGVTRYYLEDFYGALEDYDMALEINPDDYNTCVRRGWAKFRLNDFVGAMADFNRAIEGNPDNPDYLNTRGELKYRLQDYSGAIADFNKVINAWYSGKKAKSEAYFWRGLVKIDTGEKESGCTDLDRSANMGYVKAKEVWIVVCE